MDFLVTACLEKDYMDSETYDYYDVVYSDYIDVVLWDVSIKESPRQILKGDTTHHNIAAKIDDFLEGVKYCYDIGVKYDILVCENSLKPSLEKDSLLKNEYNLKF